MIQNMSQPKWEMEFKKLRSPCQPKELTKTLKKKSSANFLSKLEQSLGNQGEERSQRIPNCNNPDQYHDYTGLAENKRPKPHVNLKSNESVQTKISDGENTVPSTSDLGFLTFYPTPKEKVKTLKA